MTEQPVFHVVLEGRRVGPYDRRTIVGMRIKKTLTSEHVLIDDRGLELTVADLIGRRPRTNDFNPNRTGGFSIVQATYPASLVGVEGRGYDIPNFKGEIEARVQGDVLRVAGRFRKGLGWKEDRVKLLLSDVAHARVSGSQVELWLRIGEGKPMQRVAFELFTPETAGELVDWLPAATPFPVDVSGGPESVAQAKSVAGFQMLLISVFSLVAVVGVVLAVLMVRRLY